MTLELAVFLAITGVLLVTLPRRLAVIPLLLGVIYTGRAQVLEFGFVGLTTLRILVAVGAVRVVARRERFANGANGIDRLVALWAMLFIGMSLIHTQEQWAYRLGIVWSNLGVYTLCRIFVQDTEDVRRLFRFLCLALVPLATLMLLETYTAHSFFALMGGSSEVNIRAGIVRAAGPFAHPILAGTVGATCLPMALCLWRTHRVSATVGLCATIGIVFASHSSGPVMMSVFCGLGLLIWNLRNGLRLIRWGTVAAIIGLDWAMTSPVYYLMARIDLTGSSASWHRAQLIRSSIDHLDEWWATGTDYTRHWMPTGIPANDYQADITNQYIAMGVDGGLLLLIVFVLILWVAFRAVGRARRWYEERSFQESFLVWTLGAMLFGHVVNFLAITLFDQSASFFYLTLASISAVQAPVAVAAAVKLAGPEQRGQYERRRVGVPETPRGKGGPVLPGRTGWVRHG